MIRDNGAMSETNEQLAEVALTIAREAGELAMRGRAEVRIESTKSSPQDIVTQVDRACESLIRERLAEVRPRDGFLGEETGSTDGQQPNSIRWIVDPIDGTVNYFYGLPNWAVSIAAERDGETLAGVVVAPALAEEYLAFTGGGSYRVETEQWRRLSCSAQQDLPMSLVSTGFGYRKDRRVQQARVIAQLLPEIRDIRRCGSAAIDLCWVGAGRVDAYFEQGLKPWDLAAGAIVATEAGARVGGLRGDPAAERMTLAAPPALFDGLERRLSALDADRNDSVDS